MTGFPNYFYNIYLKYFGILHNLMRNYDILQKFTKVDKSYNIPQYFFGQINYFHLVLFNCDVLLAFCNFIRWQIKFFCWLSCHFASRQHWQIYHHRQMKGVISNIADTYVIVLSKACSAIVLFLVRQVLGWGPEGREPNKTVLCPVIIIILIIYYYKIINYGEPSQP